MRSLRMLARLVAALAGFSIMPAVWFIEAELASMQVRSSLPVQEKSLDEFMAVGRRRPIVCDANKGAGRDGMTAERALDLYWRVLDATREVNRAFRSDTLFWMFGKRFPFLSGFESLYEASGAVQDYVAPLTRGLDLCRSVAEDDEAVLREEERRGEAWMEDQRAKIQEFSAHLARARAAYEQDRPKLTALAWSLGLLQLAGWSLLIFVVLPQDYRTWRTRRASRKSASGSNQTNGT